MSVPARPRLHVVTGKGGTGKTTVASALALALASGGARVLLLEVEGRQGLAQVFDVPPLGYDERRIARAPGGGEVLGLSVEPEAALLEYLEIFYHLGRAGRALDRFGVIDFATTIAPGLRDVLLTGKAYEAVRRRDTARPSGYTYDAVVMDAPPTGRIGRFLGVNTEVVDLARVGPVRAQAESIVALLQSPDTAVHLVTLLEEMPVQETADAVAELRAAGLPLGFVVANLVASPVLGAADLDAARTGDLDGAVVRADLERAGLPGDDVVAGLLAEAREHAVRSGLAERERHAVAQLRRPVVELPALPGGVDRAGLDELAEVLVDEGVV